MQPCNSCHSAVLNQCFCLENSCTLLASSFPLLCSLLASYCPSNFTMPAWTSKGAQKMKGVQDKMHEQLHGGRGFLQVIFLIKPSHGCCPWVKLPVAQLGHHEKDHCSPTYHWVNSQGDVTARLLSSKDFLPCNQDCETWQLLCHDTHIYSEAEISQAALRLSIRAQF